MLLFVLIDRDPIPPTHTLAPFLNLRTKYMNMRVHVSVVVVRWKIALTRRSEVKPKSRSHRELFLSS